ncbi:Uu.00g112180.m01.CDS01 [Anthostomella pinea]|uniref:Uu.00g112180.m01.CDS01 n=1 Tax=Anthostomella pinea TaxID=933095 RepID=A0AAI8YGC2_9PEZI|nr:Uu.00g112180.m01.CDS01 [Anthostomella pinea]
MQKRTSLRVADLARLRALANAAKGLPIWAQFVLLFATATVTPLLLLFGQWVASRLPLSWLVVPVLPSPAVSLVALLPAVGVDKTSAVYEQKGQRRT